MARVSYERGVKCKKCGELYTSFYKGTSCMLCQNCGTHILNYNSKTNEGTITKNAEIVTIKITHKLFKEIYEEV